MPKLDKRSLGEGLVDEGLITQENLARAHAEGKRSGLPLKKSIVRMGLISEDDLIKFLSSYLGLPSVDLSSYLIKSEVIELVPEAMARKHLLIPIFKIGHSLTVAMADPLNFQALDEVRMKCGLDTKAAIAAEEAIIKAFEQYYGAKGSIEEIVKEIERKGLPRKDAEIAQDAPVVKLVNLIVMQAIRSGASDIHIEPDRDELRTRIRVDGILHEVASPPKHLESAVISRIKILANLDIAVRRAPQDGRFQMKIEAREVDIRVSIIPTIHGEKVVLRILDTGGLLLKLEELGCPKNFLGPYRKLIHRPHGMVLVTGPTGSGKTTTLYASLSEINDGGKNIITIEDPVEYRLQGIQQMQVNPKAGVTFANGLRSLLRQDPDIMMVGEIRDRETAEIAVQCALTGHLVFSTLHTNDAPSAITRLIDMGVEPFLISSSLAGAIAQRLVRRLCTECREAYELEEKLVKELGIELVRDHDGKKPQKFYRARGCKRCLNTGYRGRVALFELLLPDDRIRALILEKSTSTEVRRWAQSHGMLTLRESGLQKVLEGVTSIEEVLRITLEE